MNDAVAAQKIEVPTVPGTPFAGGFYAGRINLAGVAFALIVAPKSLGEHEDAPWNKTLKEVKGAGSYVDGYQNTLAMADAGSALARWALDLRLGANDDWYLPSLDELEIIYRHLKPGTDENDCWARAGINISALPPTYPYTKALPEQTAAEAFRKGGAEAMDEEGWYWSSTQHSEYSDYAWFQYFGNGYQNYTSKDNNYRARAVRRVAI